MTASTLGPYRLLAELGSGGMGTVFLATEGFFKRFLREAEIGKRIRHENVVATLDVDAIEANGKVQHFLVMEYVEGQTLRALLDELGTVPEELCRHIGREVAKGLAAIHAAGAVHRDLKPENVLITADHHVVKVMDLGVARLADEAMRLSQTGAFVGSIQYASPEQLQGHAPRSAASEASSAKGVDEIDGRADLHALGIVLYELATGVNPYQADGVPQVIAKILHAEPRRLGDVNPQLSPFFEEVVHQLLAKDRTKRFATAEELAQILAEGEKSEWWAERSKAIRAATKRPLRRIRIPRETALYGRDAELAKLRALFDKAQSGDGQVLLVEGEAGIGKSRLIDEFVGQLQREGAELNFLFGSYPPGGAATASGAFSTAYREHFGDAGLEDAVRERLGVAGILAPSYAALLLGTSAPTGAEPLTKDSLQTCFVHTTRSLATERTTIVLIDDLHFAPEEGRALFASLALAVPGHRILLVGTTRPGVDEKWIAQLTRLPHATHLTVPRLGPKDLVRLLADTLHSENVAAELSAQIALKSDGNPFFVFEILRGLREGQFLTQRPDGTWVTTRVIRDIQIPSSIADLVNARVADLDEDERNLLDVASCVGFTFDATLVGSALGLGPVATLQRFGRIEKKHRLVRSSGRDYVFDHHQVQETLYGALNERLREHYHAAIANSLESQAGAAAKEPKDIDGALAVDVAEHFLKGAQGAKALRYLDAALTHLEKGYLNDAAIRLAERALAVPGLVAGAERGKTLLRLAARLDLLGRREPQRAAIEEALALARATGDRQGEAAATGNLGGFLWSLGRYAEAQEHFERQFALAREIGDRRSEAAAPGSLGNVFYALGRLAEAREHTEQCLALVREIGDLRSEGNATGILGLVFWSLGRLAEAREHHERHLALAREIGDRQGEARATGNLGMVFASLGRLSEAREQFERGLALAQEIGDRRSEAIATGNLGVVFESLGHLAEAREHHERHVALAREIGDRQGEARATGNLGCVFSCLGLHAEAREHFERRLALAREIGDRRQEGYALASLAETASESGDIGLTERLLAESLAVRRSNGARGEEAESLLARGALLAREGRPDEARADLEAALAIARELSLAGVELAASAHLARLPAGDVPAALAALAAHEGRVELRIAMESRFLLWQATGDRAHIVEANRLLDFRVEHAPPDCRESMLANVRLHREIAAAAREEHGHA